MKKIISILLAALLLVSALAGCGSKAAEPVYADLTAFYDSLAGKYEWPGMMDMAEDSEVLEACFPGLKDIPAAQLVVRTPMISAVVNEIALIQCENEADAAKAAEIFRERVAYQAEGGAWYPASMEAWSNAAVITQGSYVAMIACSGAQKEIENDFNALFA